MLILRIVNSGSGLKVKMGSGHKEKSTIMVSGMANTCRSAWNMEIYFLKIKKAIVQMDKLFAYIIMELKLME
jgi:hypothetical protein